MRWMLDTDTCIGLIRQRSASAIKKLGSRSVGQVGISSITLSELAYGASRSQQPERSRAALDEFLLPLVVAPYDDACAFAYGEIRAALANAGTPIDRFMGPLDTLIAAHALALDVTLVTHNRREFERVPKLRVDDWLV